MIRKYNKRDESTYDKISLKRMPSLQLHLDPTIANETLRRDIKDTLAEKDIHPFCLILRCESIAEFVGICAVEKFGGGVDESDDRLRIEMDNLAYELCKDKSAQRDRVI